MTITTEEGLGTIDAAPAPGASVAAPSASPYLAVTDQELDRFDELRRLIPVALAGVFTGIFVATVVGAIRTLFAGGAETGLIDTLQVVVNALSTGRQIMVLRKGGIHRDDKNFRIIHPEFLLFPTYEH